MLTPKKIKIFEVFMRKPYKEFTYKEIKEFSKENSNSIIQKAISAFLKENLIEKNNIGNIILYKANLRNSTVFSYFDIIIKENIPESVKKTIEQIKQELEVKFLSIVVFGSYANKKQTKNSDIDIALFVSSKEDKRLCELCLKNIELKTILNVDYHVFTENEMLLMLKDKHENLGKQIAYNHFAVYNQSVFYSIIQEGINNGFKIIYA
jgi:predicted nucleotidyltransferase